MATTSNFTSIPVAGGATASAADVRDTNINPAAPTGSAAPILTVAAQVATVVKVVHETESKVVKGGHLPAKAMGAFKVTVDDVITQARAASAQGLKIALFLGRPDNVALPKEANWFWINLSAESLESPCSHGLRKVAGLFNKVVFDHFGMSLSFFDKPWGDLHSLLAKQADAELIVSSGPPYTGLKIELKEPAFYPERAYYEVPFSDFSNFLKEEERVFEEWKKLVGEVPAEGEYQSYIKSKSPAEIAETKRMNNGDLEFGLRLEFKRFIIKRENLQPKDIRPQREVVYLDLTKKYLEGLFRVVTLHDAAYPYPLNDSGKSRFWICKNPK